MKIYTKMGDEGNTQLVDGTKVAKSHKRIRAYGTVDELNSHIGFLVALLDKSTLFGPTCSDLKSLQESLFQLGSQLACPDPEMARKLPNIANSHIEFLEARIDKMDEELPQLRNFILPGGSLESSQAHLCRTVARRAERHCVVLNQEESLPYPAIAYLNRMSDYFFVLARFINLRLGVESVVWKP